MLRLVVVGQILVREMAKFNIAIQIMSIQV